VRKFPMIGDLDADKGGGRPYKSEMWKERLKTAAEKEAEKQAIAAEWTKPYEESKKRMRLSPREEAILARGGSLASKTN
jgi:hypothetical protein